MDPAQKEPNYLNKILLSIAIIIVIVGVVSNVYLWNKEIKPTKHVEPVQELQPDDFLSLGGEIVEPDVRYPVPEATVSVEELEAEVEEEVAQQPILQGKPLPALDESDASIKESLLSFFDHKQIEELFILNVFVRHFVVTIDNLTGKKLPQRYVFTKRPVGKFAIKKQEDEETIWLDAKNYDRYNSFVELAHTVDTQQLVTFYVRYYPLFQQAYQDLGYPGRYFNDRFVEVIEHLLDAPEVRGPLDYYSPRCFIRSPIQTWKHYQQGKEFSFVSVRIML
jgi:hypothetical protein